MSKFKHSYKSYSRQLLYTAIAMLMLIGACEKECRKIKPDPNQSLGWIPMQNGNYWKHNCIDNECNGEATTGYEMSNFSTFKVDSLTLKEYRPIGFSALCGQIVGLSDDGLRLYGGCFGDIMGSYNFGGIEEAINEFKLMLNFGLEVGQHFQSPTGETITVESKTDVELIFASNNGTNKIVYRKGLGLVKRGNYTYEEIKVDGVLYIAKCKK